MSAFTDLLTNFSSEKRFLVMLEPYDPVEEEIVTLYYSSHGFTSRPADSPANQYYAARLNQPFEFRRSLFREGKLSGSSIPGYGSLELNNHDGGLDTLVDYSWGGRRARVWLGGKDFALADYGLIFDGTVKGIDHADATLIVHLRDLQHVLDREFQSVKFLGTGGAEGMADLTDRRMPRGYGPCRNVEPVFLGVDGGLYKFRVGDGQPIIGVLRVLDIGIPLTFVASGPADGQWTVDLATGVITLGGGFVGPVNVDVIGCRYLSTTSATSWTVGNGSQAFTVGSAAGLAVNMKVRVARTAALSSVWGDGLITAIAGSSVTVNIASNSGAAGPFTDWTMSPWGTVAGIVKDIAEEFGVATFSEATFTALNAAQPATYQHWIAEGGNGLQILDMIVDGAGCYYGFTRAGSFDIGRVAPPATSVANYGQTEILETTLERLPTQDPAHEIVVRYRRNHRPLSLDQVDGTAADADKVFLTREWRQVSDDDADVLVAYPLSQPIEVDTGFDEEADAAAEAARLLVIWGVKRNYFTAEVKAQPLVRELAETVTLTSDRYGLSAGRDFVIVDLGEDMARIKVEPGLWG